MKHPRLFTACFLVFAGMVSSVGSDAEIVCEGRYDGHLQGIALDGDESIYWSFTVALVKTDLAGRVVASIAVPNHHGDLCYANGMVYVAVNLGAFNEPAGKADSWLYAYEAGDLSLAWKRSLPEVVHGAGGIDRRGEHFFIVGGLPQGIDENYVYEYDSDGVFLRRIVVESGYTEMGIQTAFYADGFWWFGCYGIPRTLIKTDDDFRFLGRRPFDASLGIGKTVGNDFLVGRDVKTSSGLHLGSVVFAQKDPERFLETNRAE